MSLEYSRCHGRATEGLWDMDEEDSEQSKVRMAKGANVEAFSNGPPITC